MQKPLAWIGGALFALFVAAALTFGAQQTVASHGSVAAAEVACDNFCPNDPEGCDMCCEDLGAPNGTCEGPNNELCECSF